jgi:hypothetical protein
LRDEPGLALDALPDVTVEGVRPWPRLPRCCPRGRVIACEGSCLMVLSIDSLFLAKRRCRRSRICASLSSISVTA